MLYTVEEVAQELNITKQEPYIGIYGKKNLKIIWWFEI